MKKEYSALPPSLQKMETYGFSWMDFITAIPSPLFVVTSYKSNGQPNACLQSWACFNGDPKGFHAILSSVNKAGHMYASVHETGVCVLNFPSAAVYDRCLLTIGNNQWETDEITASGLTAEAALKVNAPRIQECFVALECRYAWEHEITPGDDHVLMCLEVVNIGMEEAYLDETAQGRYGESGYLYNVHYPINPETYAGQSRDAIAILRKLRDGDMY
ncbi:MAG: flavin reductase family protein [Eubacteriales bacterium]|nr:flavin reductase family protein [Eubacteriales bacterium]